MKLSGLLISLFFSYSFCYDSLITSGTECRECVNGGSKACSGSVGVVLDYCCDPIDVTSNCVNNCVTSLELEDRVNCRDSYSECGSLSVTLNTTNEITVGSNLFPSKSYCSYRITTSAEDFPSVNYTISFQEGSEDDFDVALFAVNEDDTIDYELSLIHI